MRNFLTVFTLVLSTIYCFARIPSVQEAQRHFDINHCSATYNAERLQEEAGRKRLHDYYYVKLTKIPKAATPKYDSKAANNNEAFYNDKGIWGYFFYALGDYVSVDCDNNVFEKDHGSIGSKKRLESIAYHLAESYVRTHVQVYKDLLYYTYDFEVTLYKQQGSTGKTSVYNTYTEHVYYNPYSDEFIWLNLPNFREESMEKTIKYIREVYTARELIEIFGLKEPVKDAFRKTYSLRDPDAKEKAIIDILNQHILSAGPILPHNPGMEDKYNKAMFGDVSSQIQRLPSSSINQPEYPDGGDSGIRTYVQRNIKYPASLQQEGVDESVEYVLTIDENGQVKDVVANNYRFNRDLRNQTIQLLKKLPRRFTPANGYGQNVESTYNVRIDYELEPALKFEKQSVELPYTQTEEKIKITSRKNWTFTQPKNSSLSARKEGNYLIISCKARNERDYDAIDDNIIVSTTDNSASYTINISQNGAPKPYIRLNPEKLTIPREGMVKDISVRSNRKWYITNPKESSKFKLSTSDNEIIVTAPKNRSKKGRSVSYELSTEGGEYTTSLEIYQNGREDENFGGTGIYSSSYGQIYEAYYDNCGRYSFAYANLRLGVGTNVPGFDDLYIPLNLEVLSARIHFVELSLINIRADFSLDGGFDGLAWEPQLRILFPITEKVAILPYAGPTCQLDLNSIKNSTWSFSAGAIVRLNWGRIAYSDFSVGYHGGDFGGISAGVSIGFAFGSHN